MVVNSHPLYRLSYPGIMMSIVLSNGTLQGGNLPYRNCAVNGLFPAFYAPSWPFFSSMMTSLAIALSVSKTPEPSDAIDS